MLKTVVIAMMLAAWPANAQTAPATMEPSAAKADTSAFAHVYFYRYKQFQGSALHPSIYCDGEELLRMQNGRFVEMQMSPGKHTCYSNDKQAGAVVDFEAGKDYFFRTDLQVGFLKGHFRLEMVMPEQGKYDIAKLQPADPDTISHSSGGQSNKSDSSAAQ